MNISSKVQTLDVKEALTHKEYDKITDYFKQSRYELFAAWSEGNRALVKKYISLLENVMRRISFLMKSLDKFGHMIYEMGCLTGAISSISHVLYCAQKEEDSVAAYRSKLQYINHLSEIVKALDKEGPMSHTDLSAKLKMNVSTLSEAMKKVLAEDVIVSTISGKYKVYSLTDRGRHYAKYLKTLLNTDGYTGGETGKRKYDYDEDSNSEISSQMINRTDAIFPGDNINLRIINEYGKSNKQGTVRFVVTNVGKEYLDKTVLFEEKNYERYTDENVEHAV